MDKLQEAIDTQPYKGATEMTNEIGLELDPTAQHDVTKEESLAIIENLYAHVYFDLKGRKDVMPEKDYYFAMERLKKEINKLKKYIEERP